MTREDRIHYGQNAGWRSTQRPRSTGRPVTIYDGIEQGMDLCGGRWQTVCEEHGYLISHKTLKLARLHASAPEEWCGVCSGEEELS